MVVRDACPACGSTQFKKNGHIHSGKQNYQCKACGRQFVVSTEERIISSEQRTLVEHLLCERISLQTASKFSFHWWGANSTLSDRHQLDEPPAPHSVQNEAIDVPEPRHAKSWSYADSTRSASFPTNGNKIMTRFVSLRGICRAVGVSLTWLLHFMVERFAACPEH